MLSLLDYSNDIDERFFDKSKNKKGSQHVPFALRASDNRMEGIHSIVDSGLRGLLAGYKCPECGGELVANWCKSKSDYLSHKTRSSCTGMTSIHLMAQQIIAEEKSCIIPELSVSYFCDPVVLIDDNKVFCFNESRLEYKFSSDSGAKFRSADVYLTKGETELYVEIAVTSKCKNDKTKDYESIGVSAVEYDISDIRRDITEENLRFLLLSELSPVSIKWIFNKHSFLHKKKMIEDYDNRVAHEAEIRRRKRRFLEINKMKRFIKTTREKNMFKSLPSIVESFIRAARKVSAYKKASNEYSKNKRISDLTNIEIMFKEKLGWSSESVVDFNKKKKTFIDKINQHRRSEEHKLQQMRVRGLEYAVKFKKEGKVAAIADLEQKKIKANADEKIMIAKSRAKYGL